MMFADIIIDCDISFSLFTSILNDGWLYSIRRFLSISFPVQSRATSWWWIKLSDSNKTFTWQPAGQRRLHRLTRSLTSGCTQQSDGLEEFFHPNNVFVCLILGASLLPLSALNSLIECLYSMLKHLVKSNTPNTEYWQLLFSAQRGGNWKNEFLELKHWLQKYVYTDLTSYAASGVLKFCWRRIASWELKFLLETCSDKD